MSNIRNESCAEERGEKKIVNNWRYLFFSLVVDIIKFESLSYFQIQYDIRNSYKYPIYNFYFFVWRKICLKCNSIGLQSIAL